MDPAFRNTMILGVFVYGALGLGGLIAMALVTDNRPAALLAIAACGASYGAQHGGAMGSYRLNTMGTVLALALAVASFACILIARV